MFKKICVALIVVLLAVTISAQEQTGEFIGTVMLESGEVVPGVTITATGTNLVGSKTTVSDENGKFRLMALPPGKYTVKFTLDGFKQIVRSEIILEVGKTLKIDGVMQTGQIQEEVIVEGASPLVDVRKSSTSINITKEVFTKLPRGRNFTSVITTQAGINHESGGSGSGIFFEGASASENTFFVDGVNTTNLTSGASGQSVNYDSVEEVQVKSSGYSAEYGGSMGGVISVITKSGGNEFHGDATAYLDHSALNGKPRKVLQLKPSASPPEAEYDTGRKKDTWTGLDLGLSLGGYIIKDKVWFYTNFMPRFSKTERPGRFLEKPEHDGEIFTSETIRYKGTAKITASITNNIRLSMSGSMDWQKDKRNLPSLAGTSNYDDKEAWSKFGYTMPGVTLAGNLDWSIGNNSFLAISGGYFRRNGYDSGDEPPSKTRILFNASNHHITGIDDELKHNTWWNNIGWDQLNEYKKNISQRFQLKGDFTHYANFGGEHVLKAGISWSRIEQDINTGTVNEYWRFYWKQPDGTYSTYKTKTGEKHDVKYGYVRAYIQGTIGKTHANRWAMYLQDSWTIGSNLTINAGVRLEKEYLPKFGVKNAGAAAFKFDFFDKIAPRVGFSYDLKGDGKNKIFGSFGIYYDVMKLYLSSTNYGGKVQKKAFYEIVDPDWTKYLDQTSYNWTGSTDPILGGKLLEAINDRPIATDADKQPDMKPFSKLEITLGYQRMLSDNVSASIRFMHNSVINAIEDIGVLIGSNEHYYIGNPGSDWINKKFAESPHIPEGIKCPTPKRRYTSVQVQLDKKFSDNWMGGLSFTLSRLWGNFSGLSSTDEGVRMDPNGARYFDSWYLHYDQNLKETTGLLPTDRPIDMKLYGAYTFDFGLTVGINSTFKSGTPVSRSLSLNSQDGYYPLGRGTDGRTPSIWQIDMYIEQNVKLFKTMNLNLSANITNLTNNKIARKIWNNWTNERPTLKNEEIIATYDANELMKEYKTDPRFLMKYSFMPPISVRLGAKLSF